MVAIGFALISTLTSFLFEQYLYSTIEYDIDNAPSWFYQEEESQMCAFTYEYGDLNSIRIAKKKAKTQMQNKIEKIVNASVYKTYFKEATKEEIKILDKFSKDKNLNIFIDLNMKYTKVKYEDNVNVSFVKACIPKTIIIKYQKERFLDIQKNISYHRSDKAHMDLDKEFE